MPNERDDEDDDDEDVESDEENIGEIFVGLVCADIKVSSSFPSIFVLGLFSVLFSVWSLFNVSINSKYVI